MTRRVRQAGALRTQAQAVAAKRVKAARTLAKALVREILKEQEQRKKRPRWT